MSEKIRTFETGSIRDDDSGKIDYTETIPWRAIRRYWAYMTEKKAKYGGWNFKKGIPIESYEQSMLRHVQEYMENKYEWGNFELDQDKLCAIMFNIFWIMFEEGRPENQTTVEEYIEEQKAKRKS